MANAGILRDRSFTAMTEQEWDQVMAVHLRYVQPPPSALRSRMLIGFASVVSGSYKVSSLWAVLAMSILTVYVRPLDYQGCLATLR